MSGKPIKMYVAPEHYEKAKEMCEDNKKSPFYSNAKWSKIGDTKDEHATEKEAESICSALRQFRGHRACPVRGECLSAWVTNE